MHKVYSLCTYYLITITVASTLLSLHQVTVHSGDSPSAPKVADYGGNNHGFGSRGRKGGRRERGRGRRGREGIYCIKNEFESVNPCFTISAGRW